VLHSPCFKISLSNYNQRIFRAVGEIHVFIAISPFIGLRNWRQHVLEDIFSLAILDQVVKIEDNKC
jgi:hypothetical protein